MTAEPQPPSNALSPLRWTVSHIGSRELYACPVGFQRRGTLRRFYTDAWCAGGRALISRIPAIKGLSQRYHRELPDEKIVAFTLPTMWKMLMGRFSKRKRSLEDNYLEFETFGRWFASRVARHLAKTSLNPEVDVHFAFTSGALESIEEARSRGILTFVDQPDPARVEMDLVEEEIKRWEGWQPLQGKVPETFYDRLHKSWNAADIVVVNSEFSSRALQQQGVSQDKILVVPLAYEPRNPMVGERSPSAAGTLQVLWLGQVFLRKGIQYLLEAARLLLSEDIQVTIVGPVNIADHVVSKAPGNVTFVGRVLHQDAAAYYARSDLFVIPTISDGFAITQIEAMCHGLPVIATPNCGDVVTDGMDGIIVPIRDSESLAKGILRLHKDRELLAHMSRNAVLKSQQFTIDRFADTLERCALDRLRGHSSNSHFSGDSRPCP